MAMKKSAEINKREMEKIKWQWQKREAEARSRTNLTRAVTNEHSQHEQEEREARGGGENRPSGRVKTTNFRMNFSDPFEKSRVRRKSMTWLERNTPKDREKHNTLS